MIAKIIHQIDIDVETKAFSINPALNIHQGDANNHILLMKLHNSAGYPIQIMDSDAVKVSIYDSTTNKLIVSSSVDVVNAYRGVVAYLIGPAVASEMGRKTVYITISNCGDDACSEITISFVLVVSRMMAYDFDSSKVEVALTEDEYKTLMEGYGDTITVKEAVEWKKFTEN